MTEAHGLAEQQGSIMADNIVYLPSSIGELYDKITILEIKSVRVVDPDARTKVAAELALLRAVSHRGVDPDDSRLHALVDGLRAVNIKIWDTEDAVRAFAQRGDFGPAYVTAARGSYSNNDERARLKREINVLAGSTIMEVKYHGMQLQDQN